MQTEQDLQREPTIFTSRFVGTLVAILLFIALIYRQHDLALLTLLILLLVVSAKLWSRLSVIKVSCSIRAENRRLFPGETLSLSTTVANAKFLPVWVRVNWPQTRILGMQTERPDLRQETGLLWYQRAVFKQDLVASKRGCYHVGPSHIATSDVFGFFQTEKRQARQLEIVVYPRIVALKPVSAPKRDLFGTPGSQSPVKDPVYIIGTRDYQPARPSRHIHWKASARRLKLQEKVFEPSEQGRILLVLDVASFEREQADDAFESTLEVIAALTLHLNRMRLAIGFLTDGTPEGAWQSSIPTGRGWQQLSGILEMLGRLQLRSRADLNAVLKQSGTPRRGTTWAVFCHKPGAGTKKLRAYCSSVNAPLLHFSWNPDAPGDDSAVAATGDEYGIQALMADKARL